jgi:hypothetical protein
MVACVLLATVAHADPSSAPATPASEAPDVWRLRFVLPVWLPFSKAESRTDVPLPAGGPPALETRTSVEWFLLGVLEAGYRPISARFDVFGAGFHDRLEHQNGTTTNVAVDSSGVIARGLVGYEFGPFRRGAGRWYSMTPLIGVRYNQLGFSVPDHSALAGDYRWVDPLVGARADFTLQKWRVMTELDFGGFGAGSDFALWAQVSGEYMLASWCALWAGWQHYEVLLEQPVKRPDRRMLLYLTGPAVGFSFHIF